MYQFIVNPSAGTGKGYRIWKRLEKQLENEGREYRVFFTENRGDAAEIARALTTDKNEPKTIIIVGGEGTYNEVLNGVSFKGMVTLGYVPAGFRNALSRRSWPHSKVRVQCRRVLHPQYYELLDYGVVTCGEDEIFNRRFAGRCGVGLDAAVCHNLLCCPVRSQMNRLHMAGMLKVVLALKQLALARPVRGHLLLDGVRKVEFNYIYFITIRMGQEKKKRPRRGQEVPEDSGKMTVYVANSSLKRRMFGPVLDVIAGVRKKERGVRSFECSEVAVHLERPLAVHVDGESCMCQQDMQIRCIPRKIRMISA